jgi:hypothetical protein
MDLSIHGVCALSVFREKGYMKISAIDESGHVYEFNLFGARDKTPLVRDSNNRCPLSADEFGLQAEATTEELS